ncbi:protein O-mannosyl-transferase TMTC1-like [Procambarus clarkii]|uniref:protein O-mannosyl-transferase TMTC1-like n=1 Tax=Procambarus clarkii TaxID=6728 RepID=UPI0037431CD6
MVTSRRSIREDDVSGSGHTKENMPGDLGLDHLFREEARGQVTSEEESDRSIQVTLTRPLDIDSAHLGELQKEEFRELVWEAEGGLDGPESPTHFFMEKGVLMSQWRPVREEAGDGMLRVLTSSACRREEALRHYEAALRLDPEHTVALVNTATLMRTLHNNNEAEMLYKRALAVAWEAEIGESLGKLYLNTGRLEEAESTFTSVLTRHPHMLSSTVYLARVKLQQRSYLESEELLQKVLDQSPGHQEALFQLSLLYTHINRTQDALILAQQAAHNCSRPPYLCARLHAHYGDLLNDRHNVDEAAQSYLLAVELEPTLTHPHINLGALYHAKGDYTRAWRHYLTAHGQEPSKTLLLENMEKLKRAQDLQAPASIPHCLNKS